jgi:hypothetical protein
MMMGEQFGHGGIARSGLETLHDLRRQAIPTAPGQAHCLLHR